MTDRRTLITGLGLLGAFGLSRVARAEDSALLARLEPFAPQVRKDPTGAVTALTFRESERLGDPEFEAIASLGALRSLTLYGKSLMTDGQAAILSRAPVLEELAANGTSLTDGGFKNLIPLKKLRKLTIWHLGWNLPVQQRVTGAGFAALAELPNLTQFNFAGSTVTDAGLEAVSHLNQLRELVFYHTWTTDEGVVKLARMKGLRKIDLGPQFSMRIGDRGVAALGDLPELEDVKLQETILTWDGSLARLAKLPRLKSLMLDRVYLAPEDFRKLTAVLADTKIEWNPAAQADLDKMLREQSRKKKPESPGSERA